MTRLVTLDNVIARAARQPNGCLIWTGFTRPDGYGQIKINGKQVRVHRYVYEQINGPTDLLVRHACDTRLCIEPSHLTTGTYADNNRDRAERGGYARPTECHRGHPYTAENTRLTKQGWQICRTCERQRFRRR